ncbi:methyltransferase domain-containing protein [Streptomyces sp. NBC_00264]|uniref:SAM-dependent methyltransferase n=1 Tax=unclassified Streptomyces TaxID=2593676 RepID=UPI00224E76A8|nr:MULTISPECIES: class I SAM-dependent methyltransferase [unclassified Streptomyces]MCX5165794.1 methyltransferase domain-containing protein [Streptomyces sp. NBC_00305]MCX5224073.1 methyltransferase domain-containing protein [Streptomyces sp. NBC_00264]
MFEAVKQFGKLVKMMTTGDPVERTRRLYQFMPPSFEFVERTTTYCNFGYWNDGVTSLDEAAEEMATKLAEAAGIQSGDTVLDLGFGYGDQDFSWLRERQPKKIHGLNITPHQIEHARRRATKEGVADRLDFQQGSATDIPFPDNTFDRVVALESAFHFYPRSDFFKEAFRVLRPGGVLAVADVLPTNDDVVRKELKSRALSWILISYDEANWYTADTYTKQLGDAGFEQARVESIRDRVWEQYRQFMVNRLASPSYKAKVSSTSYKGMSRNWSDQDLLKKELAGIDYVMAVAHKPAE